ncbi:hypothetical protein [Mammaliicoccus sp. D-M17]|uniref:hypothetical protein n=1 Tax=Mammaliicoccus sp. D-M17 TaxID=2898677 RepID=UPI001EFAA3DE|nr:hypothetical protein [Mammaliicoccus sp. D-M17]
MRNPIRIGMYVLIVLNITTSVLKIKQDNYWEVLDDLVIILLSISIIGYMAENEKLKKDKVTIPRINNRSDD